MKQAALKYVIKCVMKKHRVVSKPLAISKMELFVALVGGFQLLTNFAINYLGVTGVQDTSL